MAKQLLNDPINDKVFEKLQEKEKCIYCNKTFKTYKKCFLPFKMGKGKKKFTSQRLAPYIYIGKLTSHRTPSILCKVCSDKVLRFMGVIPEKHDSKVFPQIHSTACDPKDLRAQLMGEKKTKWQLDYKDIRNFTPVHPIYRKLLNEACEKYCKKYITPYTPKQLVRVIRSHKNFPLEW